MTVYPAVYTLHLLAALIWVGGMFFAWMVLRPAAAQHLAAPERLKLWLAVFRGFFVWVWLAVLVLPATGMAMLHLRHSAFETAPFYIQAMIGLYAVMLALFLRVQLLQLPKLKTAVEAEDWPAGAQTLAKIRQLVGSNLLIGLVLVSIATSSWQW